MNEPHALSIGQQSLWVLHQLSPEASAYNDAGAGLISPPPVVSTLRRAVEAVQQRHEMLRSVFTEQDGVPVRLVRDRGAELQVIDASGMGEARVRAAAREAALRPFDLAGSGAVRFVLFTRQDDAVLVIGNHHIATDATSQWLIWRDLLHAYRSLTAGHDVGFSALDYSYDDYVAAEQRLVSSPQRAELEDHWLGICAGTPAAELPTDRPRPRRQSLCGATMAERLPTELADRLQARAAFLGVTPFAHLLGTFQALIHRLTAQPTFLIGCPTTTRRHRRTRDVVGYFVNTMVLRAQFDRTTTFGEASAAASRQIRSGAAHIGFPFPLVLAGLARRNGGRATTVLQPPFRIAFTMVSAQHFGETLDALADGRPEVASGELQLATVDVPRLAGQFDLNVEITRSANSLTVVFRYDTDLFDAATIRRLLDHYLRFIDVATGTPEALVSGVPLLTPADREKMLALGAGAIASV